MILKKIINLTFYIFFLACIQGCTPLSERVKLSNKLLSDFSKQQKKLYNLDTIATGGGGVGKINLLIIHLVSHECVDIERARILFINSSKDFLRMINNTYELAPYLEKFPFEYNNIKLHLSFFDDHWEEMDDKFIAFVVLINNVS